MAGYQIIKDKKLYSFDMEFILSFSKEELEQYLRRNEEEIVSLLDENVENLRRIKALEGEISRLKETIARLEAIKIEQKAAIPVWRSIAVAAAALGALIMSIFMGHDDDKIKP